MTGHRANLWDAVTASQPLFRGIPNDGAPSTGVLQVLGNASISISDKLEFQGSVLWIVNIARVLLKVLWNTFRDCALMPFE